MGVREREKLHVREMCVCVCERSCACVCVCDKVVGDKVVCVCESCVCERVVSDKAVCVIKLHAREICVKGCA